MSRHAPLAYRAANDRAPREKRSVAERFADAVGTAMTTLYIGSGAALAAALFLGFERPAWLFLGAMLASAFTAMLVSCFERRLTNG